MARKSGVFLTGYGRRAQVRTNDSPVLEDVILIDKIQTKPNENPPSRFSCQAGRPEPVLAKVIVFAQPQHHEVSSYDAFEDTQSNLPLNRRKKGAN